MVRFGAEVATDLEASSARLSLPSVVVQPGGLLLVELKVADEGIGRGLIARLWNPTPEPLEGRVAVLGGVPVGAARLTDLVERDGEALAVASGAVAVAVPARGYASVRLLPAST
jgi:hypothetical protein